MAKMKRTVALVLAAIMCISFALTTLVGCKGDKDPETTDSTTTAPNGTQNPDSTKTAYTVKVQTLGGMPVSGLTFYVYKGEDDLITFGTTDENGIGTVEMVPDSGYYVVLSGGTLAGYNFEEKYTFEGNSANIVISSSVITDNTSLDNVTYKVGDVIRDFSVVTSDGTTFKLSEALKEKKAVLINFWYSTCGPCVNEFPYMQTVYERYSDDLEIIALNNYSGDNEDSVKLFKADMGLTFPMAKDYSKLGTAFSLTGYPTSIMVDRYGVICLVEVGGLPSEKPFTAMFEHFTADEYQQKLLTSIDELTPIEVPNIEMPSSEEIAAVLNKGDITVSYAPETEGASAEYSWPFIIGEKDGVSCIKTSNAFKDSSYAILYADVEMKAGQAVAFDYFASTERGVDILFVLVDKKDVNQISGVGDKWQTCYPYVAVEDGTYEIAFCYQKDDSTDMGDDTIYLKDLRIISADDIDSPSYIPRFAATNPNEDGFGYQNYATIYFNNKDGYYHVGSEEGPLLLADLMGSTRFSDVSINLLGYNGNLVDGNTDYYIELVDYCNYSINSSLYGFCPVNQRLKELLEITAELVGLEDDPNQWLQICLYYDAYATNGEQLPDPIKGLADFSAYEALESTDDEEVLNYVTYDRLIMPRGLKYKFTPAKSGVYHIVSNSDQKVDAWIFLKNGMEFYTYSHVERFINDVNNCSMYVYLEEGTDYYIDIAYYDIYAEGTFTFTLKYLAPSYELFRIASPGYFTYEESMTGEINEILGLGIDVALGDDGYYHEDLGNGQLGSIIYADFIYETNIFTTNSLVDMIEKGAFNFSLTEGDQYILTYMAQYGEECENRLKEIWGDAFEEYAEIYQIYDVFNGEYHGTGEDMTDEISVYLDKMIEASEDAPELEGCVAVDARLAELLQMIMDKFTFEGVDHSWTKLCYYYEYLGPRN